MFFNQSMNNNKVDNDKYYKILGVNKNDSKKEIKKAYHKLAMKHHPDKGGDHDKFKELTTAFETLSDDNKRSNYDKFGESGEGMGMGMGMGGDMFSQMFSGGVQQSNVSRKGNNIKHEVNMTLKDIYNGKTLNITIKRKLIDSDNITTCNACKGQGMVIQTVRMGPMIQQIQQPCSTCNGQGKKYCINNITENIKVTIPRGSPNNHKITVYEKGDDIVDGETGDLVVIVKEIKNEIFTRKGYDLFINKDISLLEALKGFKIELDHLDGRKILIKNDKIIKPNNYDIFNEKIEWGNIICDINIEPFAKAQINDVNKIKDIIENGQLKKEKITGFMIKGSETYFYKENIDTLLKSKKKSNNIFYYKKETDKMIHCIEEEGMPYFNTPMLKGDLYMIFNIVFPDKITIDNDILIKGGFNMEMNKSNINEIVSDIEIYDLTEKNPKISYNKFKESVEDISEEESQGGVPPGGMQQCAQQ